MTEIIERGATGSLAPEVTERARFESLLEPVLPIAYRVALQLSRNVDNAKHLVQEAALQGLRSYHTFMPGTSFKAWYLRILTNCFFARYRKKRREPKTIDLDDDASSYLMARAASAGLHDRFEDPAAAILERLDSEQVANSIASLPEEYRLATTLYFIDDLSYQEIADILGCPLGTARSRLHRGRRLLQRALWYVAVENGILSSPRDRTRRKA